MEAFGFLIVLALIALPIVRWVVWKRRYSEIQQALDSLSRKQHSLSEQLSKLEQQLKASSGPSEEPEETNEPEIAEKVEPPEKAKTAAQETASIVPVIRSYPTALPPPDAGTPETKEEDLEAAWEAAAKTLEAARREKIPEAEPEPLTEPLTIREEVSDVEEPDTPPPTPPPPSPPPEIVAATPQEPAPQPSKAAFRAGRALGRLIKGDDKKAIDWETLIGGRWLNLVGIVLLVIGIVLLTQQTLLYLGPQGKVLVGLGTSASLLVLGILLQRPKGYRILAWTLVGGGWALAYFTAYASYNIEPAKIIDDPRLALAFLVLVAAGIIVHSFTYKSQLLTGLAYALGFLAVSLSPVTIFSLAASGLLAASLILVIRLMPWHYLALLGVAGTCRLSVFRSCPFVS